MRFLLLLLLFGFTGVGIADDARDAKSLRILSYNIHHGEGTDGKLDLARIAGVIKASQADVVALQEVDQLTVRTKKVDQAVELGKLTGMHVAFAKAIDLQGGAYGLAILSRFPLKDVKTHPLRGKPKQEARILMKATVTVDSGETITLLNTHLQHDDGETRERQVATINELYGTAQGTVLLAGDFNAAPNSPPVKALATRWSFATEPGGKGLLTIPAELPTTQIDYILYRGKLRPTEAKVIEEKVASDHRPVLAVVRLGDK